MSGSINTGEGFYGAGGTGGAPTDATYITQTPNSGLSGEQALSALSTGILKNTTTTGVLSIAVAGTDYQAPLTFGIANTNSVVIDDAGVADNEYAKFTASGLEGRAYSDVKNDLSLNNVENTALSTWAGSANITTLGTIATGVWNAGAVTSSGAIQGLTLIATAAGGLTLGTDVAGGNPNIAGYIKMFSSGDDAFYNTFTSGDNTANATYTLPVAMPAVTGYLLSCTDAGVMSWVVPSTATIAWNDTMTGTSGAGLTQTIGNSASDNTIAHSIIINDTQSNALVGLKIDTGENTVGTTYGIQIDLLSAGRGMSLNNYASATQPAATNSMIFYGTNYNTTANANTWFARLVLQDNSDSGAYNTGIGIVNYSAKFQNSSGSNTATGTGITIIQAGSGGTAEHIYGYDNINSSTNGLVNYTLSNTQSGATTMLKISVGTSSKDHIAAHFTGTRFSILIDNADQAPGTTTNKLYAVGGNLFWAGTQLN